MLETPKPPDGLILLDKPAGLTSHDCVAQIRKLCPRKTKVGHGGTLDPFCTGLLIVLVGRGTRLASFFQGMDKVYEGVIRFGVGTDTFDRDGKVTAEGPLPILDEEAWRAVANAFVGPAMQVPPSYSAKRVGSVRAYELSRQGTPPELEPVGVNVYQLELSPVDERDLHFRLRCSSGTYVRALARDIGTKVGSPCHCYQLCRTAVGTLSVQEANPLEDPFRPPGYVPFNNVDLGLPVHRVNHREEKLLLFGQDVPAPIDLLGYAGMVKVMGPTERFIAVGRAEGRQIHPAVVFPE